MDGEITYRTDPVIKLLSASGSDGLGTPMICRQGIQHYTNGCKSIKFIIDPAGARRFLRTDNGEHGSADFPYLKTHKVKTSDQKKDTYFVTEIQQPDGQTAEHNSEVQPR